MAGHGNCVVCPYHGWAFDKDGKLGEVPSNASGASFPKRPLVDAYPVEERGGWVGAGQSGWALAGQHCTAGQPCSDHARVLLSGKM